VRDRNELSLAGVPEGEGGLRLEKRFDPASIERRWYARWEQDGRFAPQGKPGSARFSIVIPPPNVTGKLHIGHALDLTLQDILVRWKRMRGFRTVWVPGTDHAGIATQMVVERELARKGIDRRAIGREAFVEKVWAWKHDSKDSITSQLRRLGCSVDWSRERFTLDPGLSRAVRKVFVELYRDGLIYRGHYVVNWCPRCETAVSDLEVKHSDSPGRLYLIRYDTPGDPRGAVVATTRPETMLGDTALAIHPGNPKTAYLAGQRAILPIVGRELPVIEDDFVDVAFGTGVVKVTPAHDANDFAAGQRHGLPEVLVIGPDGRMTEAAGEFAGMDRFEARKAIVARLENEKRLVEVREHVHAVGRCQRCDTVIEPYLSTQWFVKIAPLAQPALEALEAGKVAIIPDTWTRGFLEWMRNIHDWCISRQLWWGHRIPAYYCRNGHVTVSEETPDACATCADKNLQQDPDVLDTWFSSQLWPFSVFGWPDKTADLEAFYPTDVLVTGYDILFFWVARMLMAGLRFTKTAPFSVVHLHGLVRDEKGQKMSKSRGNTIDPLEAIDEYGADALRFTLAILDAPGRDIPLARNRMAGYRNFATKIWNATRFALSQSDGSAAVAELGRESRTLPDRWILARAAETAREVNEELEGFRFDGAAQKLYAFVWHDLCDWYLEIVKPVLAGKTGTEAERGISRAVLLSVLRDAVAMLHPFMPFLTEEIWEKLTGNAGTLIVSPFPLGDRVSADAEAVGILELFCALVTRVRNFRTERSAAPTESVELWIDPADDRVAGLQQLAASLTSLARLSDLRVEKPPEDAFRDAIAGVDIGLRFAEVGGEEGGARVERQLAELNTEIETLGARLQNGEFLNRAPAAVVEKTRLRLVELEKRRSALGGSAPRA
jgi:valyl-tRNA synthetase